MELDDLIILEVKEILSVEHFDTDEDGRTLPYYEEYDTDWVGTFYLEDNEDENIVINKLLERLDDLGIIKNKYLEIKGDLIQFEIYKDYKPLYRVTLT